MSLPTCFRDVPSSVVEKLALHLDRHSNWQILGEFMGMESDIMEALKRAKFPTKALLREWQLSNEATVEKFLEYVELMGLEDVVDVLLAEYPSLR